MYTILPKLSPDVKSNFADYGWHFPVAALPSRTSQSCYLSDVRRLEILSRKVRKRHRAEEVKGVHFFFQTWTKSPVPDLEVNSLGRSLPGAAKQTVNSPFSNL